MPNFSYQARDHSGQISTGTLVADSIAEAGRLIRGEGKFIVKLAESRSGAASASTDVPMKHHYRNIKRDEVIHFSHQMSVMIDTGVTLGEALDSISDQTTNEHFKAVLADVNSQVQAGQAFSVALESHSKVFPNLMISLLKASEASGTMGQMLERISAYLTKERNTLKSVRGAMIYPIVMMIMAFSVTIFLLAFVLPRFSKIFANRGAALPMPTRLLLGISDFLVNYWYVPTGLVVLLIGTVIYLRTQAWGRKFLDGIKLNMPLLGNMFRQLYITRATRTMGTMIAAGVPMLDMISITRDVTRNSHFEELWDDVDSQLREGVQLSTALFESPLIPGPVSRMIHSGEKAGRLGMVMEKIAEFTEHDFDEAVKRTTEFIEPAMVGFMGALIGFVAISLLLPIFSVGRVMAGG